MMDEIIRIYREGGEWDIEDAYVHYMQMGLDRASSRVQEYVFRGNLTWPAIPGILHWRICWITRM